MSAGLRLLHVLPTFAIGGAQVRLAGIARALGSEIEHRILALDGNYDALPLMPPEGRIRILEIEIDKSRPLSNLRMFRRALVGQTPDVLFTCNWGAIEWALANRFSPVCRHIHVEDGFGPEEATRQLARRVWLRRVALSGRSTRIVVPSRTLMDIATRRWGFDARRVAFIPNGVDWARFQRCDPSQTNGVFTKRPGELIVGTVTALRAEKNLELLIAAFQKLAADFPVRLLIVGDGPARGGLEAAAAAHGLAGRVVFTGSVLGVEHLLGQMDVYALSSMTEQMPLSLLEAMAAGRPAVATDVGDVRAMLSVENRPFVVGRLDTTAFVEKLRLLLSNAALRDAIGDANRRHASQYSELRMAEAYRALIGEGSERKPTDASQPIRSGAGHD